MDTWTIILLLMFSLLIILLLLLFFSNPNTTSILGIPFQLFEAPRKVAIGAVRRIRKRNYIGTGEYSEAFLVDDMVVKRNRERSYYNPRLYKRREFLKKSKEEMSGEYNLYTQLKSKNYTLLPEWMHQYQGTNARYYLIREPAKIPLQEGQEKKWFPQWRKNAVSQKAYNKFSLELFQIARDHGHFEDRLQPGLREDGSLFLYDLGHFKVRETLGHDPEEREWKRLESYYTTMNRLDGLSEQIELPYTIPDFVINDHIGYYKREIRERKAKGYPKGMLEYHQNELQRWERVKQTKEIS
ncbi:hypothetical protein CEE45_01595 [Candidatus Heimdallarchaeota archaeon B3_Heim]|nr:MAG: hypothetical protein CEE45_01595 [Candidatus Heimdallarchaeota archaeon B3_Heim]